MEKTPSSLPIVNCHSHIFTGAHVPPYLARTFLPWPFYYLVPLSGLLKVFSWWYNKGPYAWQFRPWYKRGKERLYRLNVFLVRHSLLALLKKILGTLLTIQVFFILYYKVAGIVSPGEKIDNAVSRIHDWLLQHHLLLEIREPLIGILLVIVLALFFKSGRNFLIFIFSRMWTILGKLPGKQTTALIARYFTIGRFCIYRSQTAIFTRLCNQYPLGTGFVLLPMDMAYMAAGPVQEPYALQMQELAKIKKNHPDKAFPFVFIDPRRMADEKESFFGYTSNNGGVTLKDCFVKEYIETLGFSGFKIYPALGYYPFEELLLPLWKYAADRGIPILTHCIRGPMFYRGSKKKEWDTHPVFQQACGDNLYEPLLLPQMKNRDFINNFTHPLNFLVLLDESLLRKVVAKASSSVKEVFGFTNDETPLKYDLRHLKLCLGHFGGEDEWARFLERDRDNFASQLNRRPDRGIDFFNPTDGVPKPGILEQVWKFADWYTIICSLMLQYDHVYADISFILHNDSILPLLKRTLQHEVLHKRVLYGTDFYVVRNYKSDKNMLADVMAGLSPEEFDSIARVNPTSFL